ncbi:TPA: acetoacetyl-CoA reductase [Raoultella planticola]|nr:acetoacetyl-CoA reductase [Raoultella planticola]
MNRKVAIVTGGISGIGDAISTKLLEEGATVIALDINKEACQAWVTSKKKSGFNNVDAFVCDVTKYEESSAIVALVLEKYKKIDILVNNAGITQDSTLKKMTLTQWNSVINVNLNSLFNVTKHVADQMVTNGFGRIINISSVNGQKGQFGQTNYSATKAGVHGFTKALAQEVARKNVTVNTVSPGYINTKMMQDIPEEVLHKIVGQVPCGRLGEPEEIADLVAYLASDRAAYITGSDVSINGGLYMR